MKKYSEFGDKLGKGIDKGILETVVVLNALGINTDQSCEGHLKWGTCAPWVDIKAPNTQKLEDELQKYWDEAESLSNRGKSHDVTDKLFSKFHKLRVKLKSTNMAPAQKLLDFLSEFYGDRNSEYKTRLMLSFTPKGLGRLESQGAAFQEVLPIGQRKRNLLVYEKEMHEFTEFLKKKIFN